MEGATTGVTEFLKMVGEVFTAMVGWVVEAAKSFLAEPGIAILLFIVPLVGVALGYMLKIIGRKRGRKGR